MENIEALWVKRKRFMPETLKQILIHAEKSYNANLQIDGMLVRKVYSNVK
jgi:hypothetical protein